MIGLKSWAWFGVFTLAASGLYACGGEGSSASTGTGGAGASTGSAVTSGAGGAMMVCAPGAAQACYDGPAGTASVGICKSGTQTCLADGSGFGACTGAVTPLAAEDCATPVDDDCNGIVNEASAGCVCAAGTSMPCYDGPAATRGIGLCKDGLAVCAVDGKSWGACAGEVLPEAETCESAGDDDCNGQTNEGGSGCTCVPGSMAPCYSGPPETLGVGPCKGGVQACNTDGTGYEACVGEVPPQPETCGTPLDDNCDGQINEGGAGCVCAPNSVAPCYSGPPGTAGVGLCTSGTMTCNALGTAYGACSGEVLPAAVESCNTAVDDTCDGQVNEGCPVTFAGDVQPIFFAKCGPCHVSLNLGGANLSISYADTQKSAYSCAGKTKGACSAVRVQNGTMPTNMVCSGNPGTDAGKAACLTAAEQATLQAWIAGGQLP